MKKDPFSIGKLKEVEERLHRILERAERRNKRPEEVLLDNFDFMELFRISRRTSQYWRFHQKLPHFRIERKVYFRLSDVMEMIRAHQEFPKEQTTKTQ